MAPKVNQARRDQQANPASPIHFPFQELRSYAKGFKNYALIGAGGFGRVYRATIPPATEKELPTQVAIKVANKPTEAELKLKMELKILGSISHPNIIKLIGYSIDNTQWQCLVYEYMPNKSVHDHIQGLNWSRFIRIIKEVASALCFLHQQNPEIIFRDLKPENILLDEKFNAKISDFGYAKQGKEGEARGGTACYADPVQYNDPAALTTKCDVFTFGMLMLELITKESEKLWKEELLDLVLKVAGKGKGHKAMRQIVHSDLKNIQDGYTDARAKKAITLALDCVGPNSKRPTMEEVCKELDFLI